MNRLQAGKFTAYTTRDGLPDDVIYSVMEDERQTSGWAVTKASSVSTSRSWTTSPTGRLVRSRRSSTGRPTACGRASAAAAATPRLERARRETLVLDLKGVAMHGPREMHINAQPPGVVIEQVRVDGEAVAPRAYGLPPGQSRFDFYLRGR